jgi:hypothetical protein
MQPAQGLGKTAGGDWDLPLILQDGDTGQALNRTSATLEQDRFILNDPVATAT